MNEPHVLILAAGLGSRYGGLKQVDGLGPNKEAIIDYSIFDAVKAGFKNISLVIREELIEFFEKRVSHIYPKNVQFNLVIQKLTDTHPDFTVPPSRKKPWGTGHAVYVARKWIQGPFMLVNGDDFYGRDAFELAYIFLKKDCHALETLGMVGYELKRTLSNNGTVSRGICRVENGQLLSIQERTKLIMENERVLDQETGKTFSLETVVSMNLFLLHPTVFEVIESMFYDFLKSNVETEKAEFYIPSVVSHLIDHHDASMRVLNTDSSWYGVTYQEDKIEMMRFLTSQRNNGIYPQRLFKNG